MKGKFHRDALAIAADDMEKSIEEAHSKINAIVAGKEFFEKKWFGLVKKKMQVTDATWFIANSWRYDDLNDLRTEVAFELKSDYEVACWLPYQLARTREYLEMATKTVDKCVLLDEREFKHFKGWISDA